MNHKKWGPLLNSSCNKMVQSLMENQLKYYEKMMGQEVKLRGPYYCDSKGEYVTVEEAAHPEYIPCIRFALITGDILTSGDVKDYAYFPESDKFWNLTAKVLVDPDITFDDWIIDELFKRDITIYRYKDVGGFNKFVIPLIKKAYPNLISQNIVSVQPMTQPVGKIYTKKNVK